MAGDDQLFPEPQATETLKCTLCGDIFEHQRLLKFHMNNHHGQHYQISVRDIPMILYAQAEIVYRFRWCGA